MYVYIHACLLNFLSPLSIAFWAMCPGLTTWNWTPSVEAHLWRKLILPFQVHGPHLALRLGESTNSCLIGHKSCSIGGNPCLVL